MAAFLTKQCLLLWFLVGELVLLPPAGLLVVSAQPAPPPETGGKTAGPDAAQAGEGGAYLDTHPTGKNAPDAPPASQPAPAQDALATLPAPGSKNDGGLPAGLSPGGELAALAGPGGLLTCGQQANMDWTTTSGSFQVIHYCTLQVPSNGLVFISATA